MTDTTAAPTFVIYSWGIVHASVCTTLSPEEATTRVNLELPTGISSQWAITDPTFASGEPNPSPCNEGRGQHYLFTC